MKFLHHAVLPRPYSKLGHVLFGFGRILVFREPATVLGLEGLPMNGLSFHEWRTPAWIGRQPRNKRIRTELVIDFDDRPGGFKFALLFQVDGNPQVVAVILE